MMTQRCVAKLSGILLLVFVSEAVAGDSFVIPEGEGSSEVVFKRDFPQDTTVHNSFFSLRIPKGWSLFATREDERYKLTVSAFPTHELRKSDPYISLHV